jgi:hypothetical protein
MSRANMTRHITDAVSLIAREGVEMMGRMVMRRPGADA